MESIILGVIAFLFVWLVAISYFLWTLRSQIAIITKNGKQESLAQILEEITKDIEKSERDIHNLKKQTSDLEKDGKLHIQKVGLLRFNPFKDTGGEQSFVLSLIDNEDTGIVLSGLYSRAGTRWYAKKVKYGRGVEVELSEEEQKAVGLAK